MSAAACASSSTGPERSESSSATSAACAALARGGGLYRPNAVDSQAAAAIASMAARAVASPIPGSNSSRRYQLTSSRGFSRMRRNASTSFTCAASRNLSPPHFSNGIFLFVSSISRSADIYPARKRTAISLSGVPSSCSSRIRSTTNCVCCCSSRAATSHGASPPVRSVQRFFVNRSAARDMSVLVTPRIGCVDR